MASSTLRMRNISVYRTSKSVVRRKASPLCVKGVTGPSFQSQPPHGLDIEIARIGHRVDQQAGAELFDQVANALLDGTGRPKSHLFFEAARRDVVGAQVVGRPRLDGDVRAYGSKRLSRFRQTILI